MYIVTKKAFNFIGKFLIRASLYVIKADYRSMYFYIQVIVDPPAIARAKTASKTGKYFFMKIPPLCKFFRASLKT